MGVILEGNFALSSEEYFCALGGLGLAKRPGVYFGFGLNGEFRVEGVCVEDGIR